MWAVITLHSLIWAGTYMRMYTNSVGQTSVCAVWTEHVQIICGKFVYTNRSLRHAQIACLITTWLYRNIVKPSAQSNQKMGFRKITPISRVCKSTFCSSRAFWSTHTLFSMRDHSTGNRTMEGASPKTRMRSLTRKIHFRTTTIRLSYISSVQRYSCSIASREEIPFAMCVQQLQNQTAQLINLEFIFHFIHIYVFMRTRSLRRRYAGWTESTKPTVRCFGHCSKLRQFRSISLKATSKACLNALIFMASFDSAIAHISFVRIW